MASDEPHMAVRRVCAIAHPDDDALWFGNIEMLLGFDLKLVLTYKSGDPRGKECLSWTTAVNPHCRVVFLGFPDARHSDLASDAIIESFIANGINSSIDELYIHGSRGEYGHPQHVALHVAAKSFFSARKVIVPHFSRDGTGAQFVVSGGKHDIMKRAYAAQFNGLLKHHPHYCEADHLDVFAG